jgi:hypothetical protein
VGVIERLSGRGTAVLTASSATEYAWEGDDLSGEGMPSVFTGAVVKGLETGEADLDGDGTISVDELYEYVLEKVREATPKQTPNKQSQVVGELVVAQSVLGPRSTRPAPEAAAARQPPLSRRDFVGKAVVGTAMAGLAGTSALLWWRSDVQRREFEDQIASIRADVGNQAGRPVPASGPVGPVEATLAPSPASEPTVMSGPGLTAVATAGPTASPSPSPPTATPAPAIGYLSAPAAWIPSFSPNFFAGRGDQAPIALVLHTLFGTAAAAVQFFSNAQAQASAHVVVALDGRIDYVVHLEDSAWANGLLEPGNRWGQVLAAESKDPNLNPNALTVSVSTEDNGSPNTAVSDAQYASVVHVCQFAIEHMPSIRWLVGHADLSPRSRSQCPGPRWISSGRFDALGTELKLRMLATE